MKKKNYILITPARNEERLIKETIECVVVQTILPKKWVIVSDGSIDSTDEIVKQYERHFEFISLLRIQGGSQRSFASKAHAFKAGYEQLKRCDYEFIGNLDADVTFGTTYYERMLQEFEQDPNLGIVGGVILDKIYGKFVKRKENLHHVAGACQLFRRACYEGIGGYVPVSIGGMDSVALIMARMKGWETRMLQDAEVFHNKEPGGNLRRLFKVRIQQGRTDYNLGVPLVFKLAKAMWRWKERPYILSSTIRLAGFLWSWARKKKRDLPDDFIRFYRKEQMRRLISVLSKKEDFRNIKLFQNSDINVNKYMN